MKRAPMMRNAPAVDIQIPAKGTNTPSPAAPAISALQERMSSMSGDSITLHINGRDVLLKLRVIAAEAVERVTMVYNGNERDQELLTESSLSDILPTFREKGQQFPAIGCEMNGIVVIADGSRRRAAAILAGRSYRVLVGELTDADMKWLTKLGNDYTPPSAYERGKRYARLLKHNFDGNLSALAESEGISRRVLTRYIKTAKLPLTVIKAFAVPNDLSMKGGEALSALLPEHRDMMIAIAEEIIRRRGAGEEIDAEDVFNELRAVNIKQPRKEHTTREFGKGVKAVYKGGKVTVQLQDAPEHLLKEIERLLEKHERSQIAAEVNLSIAALEDVLQLIRKSAEVRGFKLTPNEEQTLIIDTRRIMKETTDSDDQINRIGALISQKFIK